MQITADSIVPSPVVDVSIHINRASQHTVVVVGLDHVGLPGGQMQELDAADAVLICVPTPIDNHLQFDPRVLRETCAEVVHRARPGQTLILTSTTYVGATRELLLQPLARRGLD